MRRFMDPLGASFSRISPLIGKNMSRNLAEFDSLPASDTLRPAGLLPALFFLFPVSMTAAMRLSLAALSSVFLVPFSGVSILADARSLPPLTTQSPARILPDRALALDPVLAAPSSRSPTPLPDAAAVSLRTPVLLPAHYLSHSTAPSSASRSAPACHPTAADSQHCSTPCQNCIPAIPGTHSAPVPLFRPPHPRPAPST